MEITQIFTAIKLVGTHILHYKVKKVQAILIMFFGNLIFMLRAILVSQKIISWASYAFLIWEAEEAHGGTN